MSDPLERLGDLVGTGEPDTAAIRGRARSIVRRRRMLVGASSGVALAAVVVVAAVVLTPAPSRPAADDVLTAETPPPAAALSGFEDDAEAQQAPAEGDEGDPATTSAGGAAASAGDASSDAAPSQGSRSNAEGVSDPFTTTVVATEGIGATTFTLRVCSARATTASFASAQRFDFSVYPAGGTDGDPTWRWSDDKSFAQVVGAETWKDDECREWSDSWDGRGRDGSAAPTGRYEVVGTLTTSPPRSSEPVAFCRVTCG